MARPSSLRRIDAERRAGLPGLSIPAGLGPESKLPVGVQLIGPSFREDKLLQAGHVLSQSLGLPQMPLL